MRTASALFSLMCALPLAAQTVPPVMSPTSGPVTGGTTVTIRWPLPEAAGYDVFFGYTGVPAERVAANTLVVTTPAHLPGTVRVSVHAREVSTTPLLPAFTFEGKAEDAFERLLLPILTGPSRGAFGSEFRAELRAAVDRDRITIHGLYLACIVACHAGEQQTAPLTPALELEPQDVKLDGTPGRFVYVAKSEDDGRLSMNLRVFDTSRPGENFGTELPIVRRAQFREEVTLVGIPSDSRFRNTLRIYGGGDAPAAVEVEIESAGARVVREILLPPAAGLYRPGSVQFTDFPAAAGAMRVHVSASTPVWAFVSTTNNETQHITTITPRP